MVSDELAVDEASEAESQHILAALQSHSLPESDDTGEAGLRFLNGFVFIHGIGAAELGALQVPDGEGEDRMINGFVEAERMWYLEVWILQQERLQEMQMSQQKVWYLGVQILRQELLQEMQIIQQNL